MHLVKPPSDPFDVFITRDPIVRRIVRQLRAWSQNASDGLITGEPGVGKSLATHVLHMASSEAQAPLVVCRADEPEGVAHPWATLRERGGTLVLDGIERWSDDEQADIVQRLEACSGSASPLCVLGTSRASMPRLSLEERLHPALAQRWKNHAVHLPPLRTRPDDLAPLVEVMIRRAGRASVRLEPEAWRALAAHGWPDNVRELRQVVDATLARLTDETVCARHLALDPLAPPALEAIADRTYDVMRREVDAWYLRRLLHQTSGNISEAARRAGCSRKVLRDRLRRHGLYAPPVRNQPVSPPCVAREPIVHLRLVALEGLDPAAAEAAQEPLRSSYCWDQRARDLGPAA